MAVLLLVVVGLSTSIVRANVQTYGERFTARGGYSDVSLYVAMMHGEEYRSWAYRPLVPWLASKIPVPPASFFNTTREFTRDFTTGLRFGILNLFFLIGACLLLYRLQLELGYAFGTSFLGVVFYLGTPSVIRTGGLPGTDIALYFFFVLAALGVVRRNAWVFAAAIGIGVFAKELVVLAIPLALLAPATWGERLRLVVPASVTLVPYVIILSSNEITAGYVGSALSMDYALEGLARFSRPHGWIEVILAFGLAWIPAVYAFWRVDIPPVLRRWAWMLPLVAGGAVLGHGSMTRGLLTLFPIVLPLAALGVWHFLVGDWDVSGTHEPERRGLAKGGVVG